MEHNGALSSFLRATNSMRQHPWTGLLLSGHDLLLLGARGLGLGGLRLDGLLDGLLLGGALGGLLDGLLLGRGGRLLDGLLGRARLLLDDRLRI